MEGQPATTEVSEALILQRVAEIRRKAVQLQVKIMSSSDPCTNEGIITLREDLIQCKDNLLIEINVAAPEGINLGFQETSMPATVSTLTKFRKYLLKEAAKKKAAKEEIAIPATEVVPAKDTKFKVSQEAAVAPESEAQQLRVEQTMTPPKPQTLRQEKPSIPSPQTQDLGAPSLVFEVPLSNIKARIDLELEDPEEQHHLSVLSGSALFSRTAEIAENRMPPPPAPMAEDLSQFNEKEPERDEEDFRNNSTNVSRANEFQVPELSSKDDIDTRVRLEAMMRLRHFRERAENEVEHKLHHVQGIIEEVQQQNYGVRATETIDDRSGLMIPADEELDVNNDSGEPSNGHQSPMETSMLEENETNVRVTVVEELETSLEALATTPLSKLRSNHTRNFDTPETPYAMAAPPAPATPITPQVMQAPMPTLQQQPYPGVARQGRGDGAPTYGQYEENQAMRHAMRHDQMLESLSPTDLPGSSAPFQGSLMERAHEVPKSRLIQPKVSTKFSHHHESLAFESSQPLSEHDRDSFSHDYSEMHFSHIDSGSLTSSFVPGNTSHAKEMMKNRRLNQSKSTPSSMGHSRKSNRRSALKNPGESFAIAQRRVQKRIAESKLEEMGKKRDDVIKKERLRKLKERTRKAREDEARRRQAARLKKNGYAALARQKQVEAEEEERMKEERLEQARKRTLERLRKKKAQLRKKKTEEDKQRKIEEEKKWRIRDEKVRIFKERQEETKRVKALIAKRSKEAEKEQKPKWASSTVIVSPEKEQISRTKEFVHQQRKMYNEKHRANSRSPERRVKGNPGKRASPNWNKYSRHQRDGKAPAVSSPKQRKNSRHQRGGNFPSDSSPLRREPRRKSRKPRPRDLFPKSKSSKPLRPRASDARDREAELKRRAQEKNSAMSAELAAEDDSIMSFEEVEKWIFEQEQHFSQSNLLDDSMNSTITDDDESSPKRKPKASQKERQQSRRPAANTEPEKQSLQEKIDFYDKVDGHLNAQGPEKAQTRDRRLSAKPVFQENVMATAEEDDAFLEGLLMDSGEGIQSVISPLGKLR